MELGQNEGRNFPLSRFETMLKTNNILFFDADEFELIISHYLGIGNMAMAKKAINISLSQHPDSTALRLLRVEILLFENKLEKAGDILDALYNIEPYNPDIYIHKADIFSKNDQHQEAIELLLTANDITEDDEEIYSLIAMEYMFLEDYENAKNYFIKCLELDDEDASILYNIVYCFDYLEESQAAIDFLNIYLDAHPYSEIAWHQIGLQYKAIKDYEKALNSFDFAIISDDYFIGAYMEKAKVLEKMGLYSEAIECYQSTLKLEDPTAFAYLHIGKCYEELGNNELALNFFNKALQEDPLMDKTWIVITDFYCHQKKYKKALYYIERAIAIDEENESYWERYLKISGELGQFKESEPESNIHFITDETGLETWIRRVDFIINIKHFNIALEMLSHTQKLFPETAEVEYRLAGVYFNLDDKNKGSFHLKKALKIDPEYFNVLADLFPKVFSSKNKTDSGTQDFVD